MKRIEWLDIMKGIGILCVVASHVYGGVYFEWFYMPLFFYVSGYLYKEPESAAGYVKTRFRHLLVPYFAYVLTMAVIVYVSYVCLAAAPEKSAGHVLEFGARLAWGGEALGNVFPYLGRSFGPFWFLTALFTTQVLYLAIRRLARQREWLVGLLMAAMFTGGVLEGRYHIQTCESFSRWGIFWNVNTALMATVYFYIGNMTSRTWEKMAGERRAVVGALLVALALPIILLTFSLHGAGVIVHDVKFKFARYGTPGLNLLTTMSIIYVLQYVCSAIAASRGILRTVIEECGKASLVIMFVHTYIIFTMKDYSVTAPNNLRMLVAVVFCYALYRVFMLNSTSRKLFLGMKT